MSSECGGDARPAPWPVAIDGPAASGKSTVGAALARRYGFRVFDTGVTYRAFTLAAIERSVAATDEAGCAALAAALSMRIAGDTETRIWVDGDEVTSRLREPAVEQAVSAYSAIADVREVMVRVQRQLATEAPCVVIGRDIGTVVLPEAPVKLYLVASDAARAERRSQQAGGWGQVQDAATASRDIQGRDRIDSTRAAAPLQAAADAIVIDSTDMTLDEVLARAVEVVECGS